MRDRDSEPRDRNEEPVIVPGPNDEEAFEPVMKGPKAPIVDRVHGEHGKQPKKQKFQCS
jgi:hypothetical protein